MPKFTITLDGRTLDQITVRKDRIELGSDPVCDLLIDDIRVELKHGALTRPGPGAVYRLESLSTLGELARLHVDGVAVDRPVAVPDGATIGVETYQIKVEYLPGEIESPTPEPGARSDTVSAETPATPIVSHRSAVAADDDDAKTVYIRRVGRLVAVGGPMRGQQWDLKSGETKIGRERAQNDIVIRLDAQGQVDNSISRRHASVHVAGDKIFVEDLKSAAGTYVSGRQVPSGARTEVAHGDVIEIRSAHESTLLRVELERPGRLTVDAKPVEPLPVVERAAPKPVVRREEPAAVVTPVERQRDERDDDGGHRRRRRERSSVDDNPFAPVEGQQSANRWPTWVWFAIGATGLLVVILLILMFI